MESSMETSFYPSDDVYAMKEKIRHLKKSMTLDLPSSSPSSNSSATSAASRLLYGAPPSAKRQRLSAAATGAAPGAALLSSPDLNMLKLASPELESLIIQQQNGHVTTTPTPTQFIFPKHVTEEQEMYARGFVDALAELHHSNPGQDAGSAAALFHPLNMAAAFAHNINNSSSAGNQSSVTTITTTTATSSSSTNRKQEYILSDVHGLAPGHSIVIKEEPQTVPSGSSVGQSSGCSTGSSPPLSPIDLQVQERIKLERKRQRNRVAASKCRRRKLERIARLEDKVKALKGDNAELGTVVVKLKDAICHLKQQLMEHVNSGCHVIIPHHQ